MAAFTTQLLSVLTFLGDIIIVLGIIGLCFKKSALYKTMHELIGPRALTFSFIVALLATLGSLFYSDILGYNPCKFCWFQRIFMYPQAILLGIAAWRKDCGIYIYTLVLSILGGLIALNHYILQVSGTSIIPCSTVGYSAACSQRFVLEYGYITIPMMALTAFLLIIIFHLYRSKNLA